MSDQNLQLMNGVLETPTDTIYHYTNAYAFYDIIDSNTFRAAEATAQNDRAEVEHGWQTIRNWLNSKNQDEPLVKELLNISRDEEVTNAAYVCVFCASSRKDDVNQWRLYADNGRGYVIGIDPGAKLSINKKPIDPLLLGVSNRKEPVAIDLSNYFDFSPWYKVVYEDSEKEKRLDTFLTNAKKLEPPPNWTHEQQASEWLTEKEGLLRSGLATVARLMKHPSFSGECEVRATAAFWLESIRPFAHRDFRASGLGITSYVNLVSEAKDSPEDDSTTGCYPPPLPIRGVGIGPVIADRNHTTAIEEMCNRKGIKNVEVWKSEVPLR